VLRLRDGYRTTLFRLEDTVLAVEVANTSLDHDRTVKLVLHACSGIPDGWIVNLATKTVEVYRSPAADSHTAVTPAGLADALTIEPIPGVVVPVASIIAQHRQTRRLIRSVAAQRL